jgi:hypothetical protein
VIGGAFHVVGRAFFALGQLRRVAVCLRLFPRAGLFRRQLLAVVYELQEKLTFRLVEYASCNRPNLSGSLVEFGGGSFVLHIALPLSAARLSERLSVLMVKKEQPPQLILAGNSQPSRAVNAKRAKQIVYEPQV